MHGYLSRSLRLEFRSRSRVARGERGRRRSERLQELITMRNMLQPHF